MKVFSPPVSTKKGNFSSMFISPPNPNRTLTGNMEILTKRKTTITTKTRALKKWVKTRDGCLSGLSWKVWLLIIRRKASLNLVEFHILI